MSSENDYVSKIKSLIEELKQTKDKLKDLEEKNRKDEKTNRSQFEHMIRLEDKCKLLQSQIANNGNSNKSEN